MLFDLLKFFFIDFAKVYIVEFVLWSKFQFDLWSVSIKRNHYANLHDLLVTLCFGIAHLEPYLQRKARLEVGDFIATLKNRIKIRNPSILGLITTFVPLHLIILSRRLDQRQYNMKIEINIKIMIDFFISNLNCLAIMIEESLVMSSNELGHCLNCLHFH